MTVYGWIYYLVFFIVLILLVKPLGNYMAKIFHGEATILTRWVTPLENAFYRMVKIDPSDEMDWKNYTKAMLCLNFVGIIFLYLLIRFQGWMPFNPQSLPAVSPYLAINTAVSFVTNTNWQNYGGETTLSYLTQMLGLTVQNFLSAGTGLAILVAFIRGLTRHNTKQLGNFWVDITRSIFYILLPLSIIFALILVSQGVVQTLSPSVNINLIQPYGNEGQVVTNQVIAVGPVASQVAIKHLGTNGGGFFNANAAHPFESPTPLTSFLLLLAETSIPAALTYTYGKMVGDTHQGWAILTAMLIIVVIFSSLTYAAESMPNPRLNIPGVDQNPSGSQLGGNLEGKEVRNGIAPSALFATLTTATSTGAVISMHDSFSPMGGMVLLLMMQLSEVALGGVGSGLYGMLIFVIVAVFVAGLMVGRTPEYLGKKIEPFEMKMASLVILIMPMIVLFFTALAVVLPVGLSSISNPGAHGFSQILYAFTSQGNNNGSAFAGLIGNTTFYNLTGAVAMLMGRFWIAIPTLALAGSLANKKKVPAGAGTLSTTSPLFIAWLIAVILIVGALNFIPALALGPIVEHLSLIGL
jgi:potassium-transporting ATPase potassium-binding subunit